MTAHAVKLGASGQVVIPKIFHEELGLRPGDYFEAELHNGRVVLTPKVLVDKRVAQEIAASMAAPPVFLSISAGVDIASHLWRPSARRV